MYRLPMLQPLRGLSLPQLFCSNKYIFTAAPVSQLKS